MVVAHGQSMWKLNFYMFNTKKYDILYEFNVSLDAISVSMKSFVRHLRSTLAHGTNTIFLSRANGYVQSIELL